MSIILLYAKELPIVREATLCIVIECSCCSFAALLAVLKNHPHTNTQ